MAQEKNTRGHNAQQRPPRGMRVKVEHPFQILGRVFQIVFGRFGWQYTLVLIALVITVLANQQGVLFNQTLIDDYITPLIGQANPDFAPLRNALLQLATIYLVAIVFSFIRERMMIRITQGSLKYFRDTMFTRMETLPIKYFDQHPHGEIMSIYTNDVDTLRQMISQSIPSFLQSGLTLVVTLVNMFSLSVPLTLITLTMSAVMVIVTRYLSGKSGHFFVRRQAALGKLNGYIEEMMGGQKVIKSFCHEQVSLRDFRKLNEEMRNSEYQANKYAMIMMPINARLGDVTYVLVETVGGIMAIRSGHVTIGVLASFLMLSRNFSRPINEISMQLNSVLMGLAGAQRIFRLMDEKPEVDEGYVSLVDAVRNPDGTLSEADHRTGLWAWKHYHQADQTTTYVELKGEVTFNDVTFGYEPDKPVLHDINIYARPGQKIAFVGSTGAGKTTITNLINRFYDIQEGKIRYDGINIQKIKKADLRRSLGMVLQDTHLFTASVKDNIKYGRLDASDEDVIKAAKLANAHDFISRLPQGYDTMLEGDGSNLSQGQRQLISIARAAIADPPVLILDEATSSIDTHTEQVVQKGMDSLMKGRTTFVIAHRLSTVMNSDCIMVLEHGRIIERGNHEELLARKGRYYQLFTGNPAENTSVETDTEVHGTIIDSLS